MKKGSAIRIAIRYVKRDDMEGDFIEFKVIIYRSFGRIRNGET